MSRHTSKWQRLSEEEKQEYYRKRRERYRAAHPVLTDKQGKIINVRSLSPEQRAKMQAERDMVGEIKRRQAEETMQDLWAKYRERERARGEVGNAYDKRMLIAQYRERIEELTAERERLMEITPLTSEIIGRANQLSQLKYNYARKIAELLNSEDIYKKKGNKYILQEYGIRLD